MDQSSRQALTEAFQGRIREVAEMFQQGDLALAWRRLMDAALDTRDTAVFDQVIAYMDCWEDTAIADAEKISHALGMLSLIEAAGPEWRAQAGEVLLESVDLRKQYASGSFSLGPISLSLKRGEMMGLVGENGNGKTTLLRMLARELSTDGGRIEYFLPGSDDSYDLRSRLAYIPQRTPKWYGSLMDNLKFTLACYGVHAAANESQVLMMVARMGLWNYRHLQWRELSSGYKMRFELARTFLRRPDLLLLDEPLANLDMQAQQTILEDLKSLGNSLSNPMGIVLSSQQLYEVEKVSDRVLFLRKGQALWQAQQTNATAEGAAEHFLIEFETPAAREALQEALSVLDLEKLSFNGGTYLAQFPAGVTMPMVMAALGAADISLLYIRDISRSTRRFFVQP